MSDVQKIDWDTVRNGGWKLRDGKNLRVLSLDGGGIRGIFSASYLAKLESEMNMRLCDFFDLIVGTSTGGIIALGLSIGVPAQEIADSYIQNASKIFKPRLMNKNGFRASKYTNGGLIEVLQNIFKQHTVEDALSMLCIPSVEHSKASPKVFKTPHRPEYFIDAKFPMWKVAQATSAAPTYFPAAQVTDTDCKIDGGLWANNPIMVAFTEGCILGYNATNMKVLSLGTGSHIYSVENSVAMKSGLWHWKSDIVDLTMQVQTTGANFMAQHILRENALRVNCTTKSKIDLGSTNEAHFAELSHEADVTFAETYKDVKKLFNVK